MRTKNKYYIISFVQVQYYSWPILRWPCFSLTSGNIQPFLISVSISKQIFINEGYSLIGTEAQNSFFWWTIGFIAPSESQDINWQHCSFCCIFELTAPSPFKLVLKQHKVDQWSFEITCKTFYKYYKNAHCPWKRPVKSNNAKIANTQISHVSSVHQGCQTKPHNGIVSACCRWLFLERMPQ